MAPRNRFDTAITASDDTASGVKSADKRFKKLYANNNRYASESAKAVRRSGLGATAEAFGEVERAASRVFGARSVTATAVDRLGGIGRASRYASESMATVARQGGIVKTAMAGMGLVVAGTVGVLVAAGVAGFQFVKAWSNGGAQLGRLSASLGIATRDLQAFQGAAERSGVSREAMDSALGGIGSSIHAGVYGQNPEALAALNKLGIPIKRKADGTVDVAAMTISLADATSKIRDPYAQQHLASIFGFQEALPAFRRGGRAMRADMADVTRYGGILSDEDIATGSRIQRKGVIAEQMGRQVTNVAGRKIAGTEEWGYDRVIEGGRRLGEGAGLFDRTVTNRFTPAVDRLVAASMADNAGPGGRVGAARLAGSVRRNNPGNIRPTSGVGFNTYATPEAGLEAMAWQLRRYQNRYGLDTVRGVVGRWAPPQDNNDTEAYIRAVTRRTGFGADQRLNLNDPATLSSVMGAMITQEHGRNPFSRDQILASAGGAPAPAAPAPPQRLIHEFRGLPRGVTVTTRSEGSGDVAIGHAMPGGL